MERCSWKLFNRRAKDCISCVDYDKCLEEVIQRDPATRVGQALKTEAIVEEDAKEYAEFLRELDRFENEEWGYERNLISPSDLSQDEESDEIKELNNLNGTKSYKELSVFAEFFDSENIPFVFIPPHEIYASTFLMVGFTSPDIYIVRTTSLQGVANDIKFITKLFKAKNNKTYKFVKRGSIDIILPIVRNIIAYRKGKK